MIEAAAIFSASIFWTKTFALSLSRRKIRMLQCWVSFVRGAKSEPQCSKMLRTNCTMCFMKERYVPLYRSSSPVIFARAGLHNKQGIPEAG